MPHMLTSSRGGAKRRREGWATKRTLTRVLVPAARFARVVQTNTLKEAEGAGNAGCALHPRPRVQQKNTRVSNHRYTASTGIPCTMVLTVSFVISPVTGLFCHRHFAGIIPRTLAPASGRQDHTTSPSASAPLVLRRCRVHRIPYPTSVTIASRPSSRERDGQSRPLIWG